MNQSRVIFYSKEDLARFFMREKVENILNAFSVEKESGNINDIIELYNVKLYVDSNVYNNDWGKEKTLVYKNKTSKIWSLINMFFNNVTDSDVIVFFDIIENVDYICSFWQLIEKCKVYNQISDEAFVVLFKQTCWKSEILRQKNIVDHYNTLLRQLLIDYNKTAELLITHYAIENTTTKQKLNFPKSLKIKDKEDIIIRYIENEDANLNYLRLIVGAKETPEFKISDTTRLKAKRKYNDEQQYLKENNKASFFQYSISVSFSPTQTELKREKLEENRLSCVYSEKWIRENTHPIILFQNFLLLFNYLDSQYRITLVAKKNQGRFLDIIGLKATYEYANNFVFNCMNTVALQQIIAYQNVLKKFDVSLEQTIVEAFNLFSKEYAIDNLNIKLAYDNNDMLSQIRFILPEMDSILKRYKLYVENGEIDLELLAMSSDSPQFRDMPSTVRKKYVIGNNDVIGHSMNILFSDQSVFHYIGSYSGKYTSLFDLLRNEEVIFDDIEDDYKKIALSRLIDDGYLIIEKGIIKFKNEVEILILHDLYYNSYISYWHKDPKFQSTIVSMIEEKKVFFKSALFTNAEADYFDYYLKSIYSNGKSIRNRYAHGTNKIKNMQEDYFRLLQLFVLMLWKIIDDVLCSEEEKNSSLFE